MKGWRIFGYLGWSALFIAFGYCIEHAVETANKDVYILLATVDFGVVCGLISIALLATEDPFQS